METSLHGPRAGGSDRALRIGRACTLVTGRDSHREEIVSGGADLREPT
jgi:hypothetical protein